MIAQNLRGDSAVRFHRARSPRTMKHESMMMLLSCQTKPLQIRNLKYQEQTDAGRICLEPIFIKFGYLRLVWVQTFGHFVLLCDFFKKRAK
jgi:hypothetical protein